MQQHGARLEGKVAIVTGAGTRSPVDGVGRATSILFARHGAKVLLVDRDVQNAEKTLAAIEADGGEASVFIADVSQNDDCQAMAEVAIGRYGGLHILFNSAAIGSPGTVVDADEAVWDKVMEVNLKGMMLTSKHAIPKMIDAGGGSIINIASIDGMRANAWRNIAYAVSKGGAIALTRNMAVHHGRDNIRVNCIAPGHIYASMTSGISDEMRDLRRRAGPLGTEGTAWDIAWAGVFLASDESRWISGVVLPIDAGLLAATPLAMLSHLR
ncbi:MAG: SDR family oxidoreductase [Candidatus Poribacteria bacterium]|nr:SDR family oxidoreductase [Candidatus Poribacteria bacterium]